MVPLGAEDVLHQAENGFLVVDDEHAQAARLGREGRHGVGPVKHRGRGRFGDGEFQDEFGAHSGLAFGPNAAAVLLHDAVGEAETEPGALALRFGGEERVEDLLEVLRADTRAVVNDPQPHLRVGAAGAHDNVAIAAEGLQGLPGVAHDVEDDLLELVGIAEQERQPLGVFADEGDVVDPHVIADDLQHGVGDLVEVDQLALRLVLAGETEQAVDDLVAAEGAAGDAAELVLLLRIRAGGLQQLGKTDHGGERVVELMGDARDELADSRELLALHELGLGSLQGVDRLFQVGPRGLQVPGHVVEGHGHRTAFVAGKCVDAPAEVTPADGLGMVAQQEQRLRDAPDQVPDDQAAEKYAREADGKQGGAGAGQFVQALLIGGEQDIVEAARRSADFIAAGLG